MGVFLIILLSIIHTSLSSFTYQLPLKRVSSFAFSSDLEYLAVVQGFYVNQGYTRYYSYPTSLFKRTSTKYQLIGSEYYPIQINYSQQDFPNNVIGKLSMADSGKIFITANNDNKLRIYKVIKNTFIQSQVITIPNPSYSQHASGSSKYQTIKKYKITGDGKTLVLQIQTYGVYIFKLNIYGIFQKFAQFSIYKNQCWDITNNKLYIYQTAAEVLTVYAFNNPNLNSTLQSLSLTLPKTNDIYRDTRAIHDLIISKQESQNQLKIVLQVKLSIVGSQYSPLQIQLRILSLNLITNKITYVDSIVSTQTNIVFYLTRNGKYLVYADSQSPKMMAYSLENGKPQLYNKYWNFSKPSGNVFISQDGKYAATTNAQSVPTLPESKIIPQLFLLFATCPMVNCFKCDFYQTYCYECDTDFVLSNGACIKRKHAHSQSSSTIIQDEIVEEQEQQGLTDQQQQQQATKEEENNDQSQMTQQQFFFQVMSSTLSGIFFICLSLLKLKNHLKNIYNNRLKKKQKADESMAGTIANLTDNPSQMQ